ncbi:RES domain-containing protein [Pseudomonas sp. 65/3-MNA-CIBAN-0223]|uniref:RES domain-containing protein n=1 Tax=Pseudomonas sp. 65/3-MNA-CIBAN-0223 TaxID=3140476 RepID=UPI00332CFF99
MRGEFAHLGDLPEKQVCHECIGEKYLSGQIEVEGIPATCDYCAEIETPCLSIVEIAGRVQTAIEQHYSMTPDGPDDYQSAWLRDKESDYNWEREGEPVQGVVAELLCAADCIAADILELLSDRFDCRRPGDPDEGETEFAHTSFYELKAHSHRDWDRKWQRLEVALKNEVRFFNQEVLDVLKSVFNNLHQMQFRTLDVAVVQVGPSTALEALYRAREFQSSLDLKKALESPVGELGPPPGKYARAGRMNASGISVFYGSEQAHSALSEIRPVVGSNVVVAKFSIIRPLHLLDLRALKTISFKGSLFDPSYAEEKQRIGFLSTLTDRLTVPVMPGEQEREYLTTQAVADYLAGMSEPELDGILFPSVQDGKGVNVVLFHKAALVEPLAKTGRKVVSASIEDIDYEFDVRHPEYEINTETIEELGGSVPMLPLFFDFDAHLESLRQPEHREPSLRLELESIEVHDIKAVVLQTTVLPVRVTPQRQHRAGHTESGEPKF